MKYFFLLLLFSFLCFGDLSAQVGINNPNPSQALDVGGKIKVGDDQITPVAGTIRYNRVTKTFEGYDGAEWSVFNTEEDDGGGNTPASGDIVVATIDFSQSISPEVIWRVIGTNTTFENVPSMRLYVTSITISPQGPYDISLRGSGNTQQYVDGVGNQTRQFSDPNGHLLILRLNNSVDAFSIFNNDAKIELRGILQ